ncbi:MAG: type-F conjugative transfer system pilin assembly protein TrbC [Rhodocyclaceae bacterium]|nr:type-F conjugative transfer system pilin assembly protein TrbC [Rhodocyclaceae bacterium]
MAQAYEQALSQKANAAKPENATPAPLLQPDALRKNKAVDPMQIANKYREAGIGKPKAAQTELLIFVSTSVPTRALEMLGKQASKTGAVLVMRGLKKPLGTKGALTETEKAMQPVVAAGGTVQINPELFNRYGVSVVPTFVITADVEEGCGSEQCVAQSYALAGDVTLEYALETWSSRGGRAGQIADAYLARMQVQQ